LDSNKQNGDLRDFLMRENRFTSLYKSDPENAETIFAEAERQRDERIAFYQAISKLETPQ
jgi:pyruvate-ferredoxin/flavodoxin oxidoreductase